MEVTHLSALSDNYMYVLKETTTNDCAIIDPVDSQKMYDYVKENKLNVKLILTTHFHSDHAGGNKKFKELYDQPIEILGGDRRIEAVTRQVVDGEKIHLSNNVEIECLHTPCHTREHICYVARCKGTGAKAVFTGDTMFIAGCGRFFEGTAQEMYTALIEKLGALPDDTLVYCGHEYTVKNLQFARKIEPRNCHVIRKLKWAENERKNGNVTIPSTMEDERLTNPFMRVNEESVIKMIAGEDEVDPIVIMAELRSRKDNF